MEPYIIIMCIIIVLVAIAAFMFFRKKKQDTIQADIEQPKELGVSGKESLGSAGSYEMMVKFDDLPAITKDEEAALVEVKNEKLLARIDNAVPGTLQAITNTRAVKAYQEAAKSAGQLYQVIIPQGAVLDKSRAMEGAFRGYYREVANRIQGQADLVPIDNAAANKLAVAGTANAVMGVASMIVGQYYMTEINDQLEDINARIEKIADFQQNEFKSKVYALVAEVQKSSTFQVETIENNEVRNRELNHLQALEHECAELLGQANLSLQDIASATNLDYAAYEKKVGQADLWYQYQQILLEVMYKISDLTFALNLGAISRENSYALYLPYANQSKTASQKLNDWHMEHCKRLGISTEKSRRKRQGISGFVMSMFGHFNDDFNYKKISQRTASLIEHQAVGVSIKMAEGDDLFKEDIRLIAKDGKLYYLPKAE